MVTMMTPAVVMSTAPAPSVMVTTSATMHMAMAMAMPVSPDLDHRVVLNGDRRHSEPGGSSANQSECRSKQREAYH
jgi:hypothetical protein